MVSNDITNGLLKSKLSPCEICSLRVKIKSVLCVQCGKWIDGRCTGVKRLTEKFSRNSTSRICEGNIAEAVEQEERPCNEEETVREFTSLGDRIRTCEKCEAAVIARTRYWRVKHRECGELLYSRRFSLKLKGAVYQLCKPSNDLWK